MLSFSNSMTYVFFTMQMELAWRVSLGPLNSVSATQTHVLLPGAKFLSNRFALCGKEH